MTQVSTYLSSKSWETRIAAGQAVEAIASNVKQWDPQFVPKREEGKEGEGEEGEKSPLANAKPEVLAFNTFDIKQVYILLFIIEGDRGTS